MTKQEHRRTRLRSLEDPQAQRTREQLVQAFLEAAENGTHPLSVRWLCERAEVGRSTFYTHFSAVEDLAAFVLTAEFDDFIRDDVRRREAGVAGLVAARIGLQRIVDGLVRRRDIVSYAVRTTSRAAVESEMVAWLAAYAAVVVRSGFPEWDDRHRSPVDDFISAGTVHAALNWIDDPDGLSQADLVEVLLAALPLRLRAGGPSD